jgi:hypothetical protein
VAQLVLRVEAQAGHLHAHVQALAHIDPDLLDGGGAQALQVCFGIEQEPGSPERVLHPGAAELVQEHAQSDMLDIDTLQHGIRWRGNTT